jgi:hypothetical protein
METLAAGKEIVCYCTKCKMDLAHVIIAMKGDRVVRVKCKTCQGDHAYKASKGVNDPAKAPKAKAPGKKASAPKVAVEEEWTRLMRENSGKPLRDYGADQSFSIGDRLKHPVFGEGVVTKQIFPKKLEICFSMDLKVLIHAG